jgi:hypothetical protein
MVLAAERVRTFHDNPAQAGAPRAGPAGRCRSCKVASVVAIGQQNALGYAVGNAGDELHAHWQ